MANLSVTQERTRIGNGGNGATSSLLPDLRNLILVAVRSDAVVVS